jgi:type VI secretion system protein VasD
MSLVSQGIRGVGLRARWLRRCGIGLFSLVLPLAARRRRCRSAGSIGFGVTNGRVAESVVTNPGRSNLPSLQKTPKTLRVVIRLHAGDLLNSDTNGQSLPVVARIYELREKDAFERAPAAAFDGDKATCPGIGGGIAGVPRGGADARAALRGDRDAARGHPLHRGVGLFRARRRGAGAMCSMPRRRPTGLTLGVHACALSVASGQAWMWRPN